MSQECEHTVKLDELKLVITEEDLDPDIRNALKAAESGDRLLGGAGDMVRILYDSIPDAIARRLRKIIPEGFVISEVQLKLALSGKLLGVELGGDVLVTLRPQGK